MTGRAQAILDRFPRHLGAGTPGKLFALVVDASGQGLDVQTSQVGQIRRAHRPGEAEQERDIALLAGLHDLDARDLDLLRRRLAALAAAAEAVGAAGSEAAADLGSVEDAAGLPASSFPPFPGEGGDLGPSRARLASALREAATHDAWLEQARRAFGAVVDTHRTGNGTVGGLLHAAAAYLALEVRRVDHSEARYWHLATCRDAFAFRRPLPPGSVSDSDTVAGTSLLALEENPYRFRSIDPVARRHGDAFRVLRGGFEPVPVTIVVRGVEDRTLSPMVVNLDTGFGVATTATVPDGQDLRFERDGRVTLGGAEVTRSSYTFAGGVFADEDAEHPKDFVWGEEDEVDLGDRLGRFAVTRPLTSAFDEAPGFPHTDAVILPATMDRGESRWAFFVAAGRFPGPAASGETVPAAPRPLAGLFDESVFLPDPAGPPSGLVGLEWDEREPFAVKLWLPLRLSTLDVEGEAPVRERLRMLLGRHRAAGVHLYVAYADPRWTLGTGILRDLDSTDPLGNLVAGTATWELPT